LISPECSAKTQGWLDVSTDVEVKGDLRLVGGQASCLKTSSDFGVLQSHSSETPTMQMHADGNPRSARDEFDR